MNAISSMKSCSPPCNCTLSAKVLQAAIYYNNTPDGNCSYCPGVQGFSVWHYSGKPCPSGIAGECQPVIYPICTGAAGVVEWLNGQASSLIDNPLIAWNTIATAVFAPGSGSPSSPITYGQPWLYSQEEGGDNTLCGGSSCWGFTTFGPTNQLSWLSGFGGFSCSDSDSAICAQWGVGSPVIGTPTSGRPAFYAEIVAIRTNCPNAIFGGGQCCYWDSDIQSHLGGTACNPTFSGKCVTDQGALSGSGTSCADALGFYQYVLPLPDFNWCNTTPGESSLCYFGPATYGYSYLWPQYYSFPGDYLCGGPPPPSIPYYACPSCQFPDPFFGSDDP